VHRSTHRSNRIAVLGALRRGNPDCCADQCLRQYTGGFAATVVIVVIDQQNVLACGWRNNICHLASGRDAGQARQLPRGQHRFGALADDQDLSRVLVVELFKFYEIAFDEPIALPLRLLLTLGIELEIEPCGLDALELAVAVAGNLVALDLLPSAS
jgi:hypothetical protein